jgi:hypothetical protein
MNALCSKTSGYGVNEMEFSTDEQRQAIVFAYKLGHNIGKSTFGADTFSKTWYQISLCSKEVSILHPTLSL